jgi:hypothetical protein
MLAPTLVDLQHLVAWALLTIGISTVLYVFAKGVDYLQDLATMRASDTPEPQDRKRLNVVVEFPPRRFQ